MMAMTVPGAGAKISATILLQIKNHHNLLRCHGAGDQHENFSDGEMVGFDEGAGGVDAEYIGLRRHFPPPRSS